MNTVMAKAHVPETITKELAIVHAGQRSKIRLSSNWLSMKGFEAGCRHTVEVISRHGGLRVRTSATGVQKIYQRTYAQRKNNPFETQLEIANQTVLSQAIPSYTERVHFEIRQGEILIRPVANRTFAIRRSMRTSGNPLTAFVAMTSGVDCHSFSANGFDIDAVCEYRPAEKRDNTDKTETGALNVLFNSAPRVLFNEDVFRLDMNRIRDYAANSPAIGCLSLSIQCDDFGSAKAEKLKNRSLDDLSTSADMAYPALRLVEELMPASVLIENVPGFFNSAQYLQLIKPQLRRMGYFVQEQVMRGEQYGGKTLRTRGYMVASVYPGFEFPQPTTPDGRQSFLLDDIQGFLEGCRDVSHCKAVHDGIATGRDRHITVSSLYSPTIMKSQSRQAKDSVYIATADGRYLLPSNALLEYLNGFPSDLVTNVQSTEIQSEIIGQSVEYPMHDALIRAIGEHLLAQNATTTFYSVSKNQVGKANSADPLTASMHQDELFS